MLEPKSKSQNDKEVCFDKTLVEKGTENERAKQEKRCRSFFFQGMIASLPPPL